MFYSFRNKETGEITEESMPMAEREPFLEAHPELEQVLIKAPKLVDPFMLGRLNAAGKDFQRNVIGRMKAGIPKNNLSDSRFGHNIAEV